MELRDYLRIIRRRWLLIVSTVLGVVAVAALVTTQMTPQYASTARVFISTTPSNSSDAYQGGLFSAQRVSSYADLISGLELSQRVIDELGLDMSAAALADKIDATVVPDTVVLKITVTDSSPLQAQRINKGVVDPAQAVRLRARDPARTGRAAPQGHRGRLPPAARQPGLAPADPQHRARRGPRSPSRLRPRGPARDPRHHRQADRGRARAGRRTRPLGPRLREQRRGAAADQLAALTRTPRPRPSACCAPTCRSSTSTRTASPSW